MESLLKYKVLISELPVLNQKSVAQKTVWIKDNYDKGILTKEHSLYISDIINSSGQIVISRRNILMKPTLQRRLSKYLYGDILPVGVEKILKRVLNG